MGGSSKKVTTGYRYNMGLHMGFCLSADALLELGAGEKKFWAGELTANGSITVNRGTLFGGDEKEGGIVGTIDVMFGEEDQVANAYLAAHQGAPQPAYRGFFGLVFRGQIAVNNPYIKPWYARIRSIVKGWEGGTCWYEEKAAIPLIPPALPAGSRGWDWQITAEEASPGTTNLVVPSSGWNTGGVMPFGNGANPTAWPKWTTLWIRKTVTVPPGADQTTSITVENGCVVFINGVDVGAYNRANANITDPPDTVTFTFGAGLTYELAVKAFDEAGHFPTSVTYFNLTTVPTSARVGMNPAHIIYQALTDSDFGMGYPTTLFDDSWEPGADWLYGEGFGLCMKWNSSTTIQEFTQIVADHAGLVFGQDRRTGLFRLRLIRQDYNRATLRRFTRKDVRVVRYQRPSLADTVNEIIIQYTDTLTGKEATTAPLQNLAHIQAVGRVISQTLAFPGIPTHDLAVRVGMRELQARSSPLWRFSLEFKRLAFDLMPGEPFVLDLLDDPELGMELVLRAGELDFGELGGESVIRGECVEDVFSLPAAGYVDHPGIGGTPPDTTPTAAPSMAYEAPYVEVLQTFGATDTEALPAAAGYLAVLAQRGSGSPSNFGVNTRIAPDDYALVGSGDFSPSGQLLVAVVPEPSTMMDVADGADLDGVEVGDTGWLGEGAAAEAVRVDAVSTDEPGFGGYAITVGRGCGDTVPKPWPIGTRFWVSSQGGGGDPTQYADGDVVNAKATPRTADGELPLASATELTVTMDSRQVRPYPPGRFKLNGAYYPAAVDRTASAAAWPVTWAHRDRLLQADEPTDTDEDSIGPEPTTRYVLRFKRADTSALLVENTNLGAATADVLLAYTGNVVAELYAVSDNGESWQRHTWTFAHTKNAGTVASSITGTAYVYQPPTWTIDGNGS